MRMGLNFGPAEQTENVLIFYGHSLPSADSRRAVVSFWHNIG